MWALNMSGPGITFLKLGGSLITDKDTPHTARMDVLARLAGEIAQAKAEQPNLSLIIGHGSGSFGHVPAKQYNTRQGVSGARGWQGFVTVWREARALNQVVLEALTAAHLPVMAFPPSASAIAHDGRLAHWDLAPLRAGLQAGIIPLVNGDTVFDEARGGTILSTEDLFIYLAHRLHPQRILLAGLEPGVWADYPARTRILPEITSTNFNQAVAQISGSASVDVTGGMLAKVRSMLALSVSEKESGGAPGFHALIFSGAEMGNVARALRGEQPGTRIH